MKRKLIYFAAFFAAITVGFSSCSDDDPVKINKTYTGEELTATNGGEAVTSATMNISTVDNNAEITLANIVNGQPEFKVNAIITNSQNESTFEGEGNIDGMNVSVKGTMADEKATVNVNVEITSQEILKSWTYNVDADSRMDAIIFDLQNKSNKVSFSGKEISTDKFNEETITWIQMIAGMGLQKLALTFSKDGYVGIEANSPMAPVGQQDISIQKLARYYYNPTTKMLIFDVPLGGLLGGEAEASTISAVMQVPFACKIENGVLSATIDSKLLTTLLPLIPTGEGLQSLLGKLDSVFPPEFSFIIPAIKTLITDIVTAITDKDVTSLTIGAKLMPVSGK